MSLGVALSIVLIMFSDREGRLEHDRAVLQVRLALGQSWTRVQHQHRHPSSFVDAATICIARFSPALLVR